MTAKARSYGDLADASDRSQPPASSSRRRESFSKGHDEFGETADAASRERATDAIIGVGRELEAVRVSLETGAEMQPDIRPQLPPKRMGGDVTRRGRRL
jgi:hypothetical protein